MKTQELIDRLRQLPGGVDILILCGNPTHGYHDINATDDIHTNGRGTAVIFEVMDCNPPNWLYGKE